ncbi:8006_t:CDS:2, partial [Ambispora leptoticha]
GPLNRRGHIIMRTFLKIKSLVGLTADSYIDLHRFDEESADISNEATRREFISSILYDVAACYDGEIKVKREDINQGVSQNAIQLQDSSQRNEKKRTYNEVLREVEFGTGFSNLLKIIPNILYAHVIRFY